MKIVYDCIVCEHLNCLEGTSTQLYLLKEFECSRCLSKYRIVSINDTNLYLGDLRLVTKDKSLGQEVYKLETSSLDEMWVVVDLSELAKSMIKL